jgi:carboxyl-terminal processing protease
MRVRAGRLSSSLTALLLSAALAQPAFARQATAPAASLTTDEALRTFDAAWQKVRDTHFDPALNGVDWNAVREELRPRAARAGTRAALRAIIAEMLSRLGQSHFYVIEGEGAAAALEGTGQAPEVAADPQGYAGFDVRLVERRITVTSVDPDGPAVTHGIRPGWVLL